MDESDELILENFKCFGKEQRGSLRPITLLVGENSTGKTSFMASYMALHQCFGERYVNDEPDFNLDPFKLGSFENIVHKSNSKDNGKGEFKIGFNLKSSLNRRNYQVKLTFRAKKTLPHIHKIFYDFGSNGYVGFERTSIGTKICVPRESLKIDSPLSVVLRFLSSSIEDISFESSNRSGGAKWVESQLVYDDRSGLWAATALVLTQLAQVSPEWSKGTTRESQQVDMHDVASLVPKLKEIVAIAPMRSRPKRTYDPIQESPYPEGSHFPMDLMHLSKMKRANWKEFRNRLIEFGKPAELFSDIKVKSYENSDSGPFQVQFKVRSGKFMNFVDVGYGASQCLPVLTSILNRSAGGGPKNALFLLQQPEVHLHPRAQAEIGNLVCKAYGEFGNRFMIETHSDYIVDRIRVMVRKGVVDASDVSIIYFEREPNGNSVKLYNLEVDSDGNILNAPNSYRDFFVAETDTVLGFRD